jgi:hypothetical protein
MSIARRRSATAAAATAALSACLALGATAADAATVAHHSFFESPSRNIGCVILDGTARCDIVKRTWPAPPRPAGCPSEVDYGQGLTVSRTGAAQIVCAGDTALDPHAAILPYGGVDAVGVLRCTSRRSGMRCRSTRTGHGFVISSRSYSLF